MEIYTTVLQKDANPVITSADLRAAARLGD